MKALPKVVKGSIGELSGSSIKPVVIGLVASVIGSASAPAMASTDASTPIVTAPPQSMVNHTGQQVNTAIILAKPSLDGQVFAAHYSHSSHASHSSHYSCTPGSTC